LSRIRGRHVRVKKSLSDRSRTNSYRHLTQESGQPEEKTGGINRQAPAGPYPVPAIAQADAREASACFVVPRQPGFRPAQDFTAH
jgi:hypothetical protein